MKELKPIDKLERSMNSMKNTVWFLVAVIITWEVGQLIYGRN